MTGTSVGGRLDGRIRALRPAKRPVDPWRPLGVTVEEERRPEGGLATWLTVFLAGSECPFTCVFCDLWRQTLDAPTPVGAIPAQLDEALARAGTLRHRDRRRPDGVKLYNASNFFDQRAVPVADWPAIVERLAGVGRVTVECHPRLVGESCLDLAERLAERGVELEVAMGLETVHPGALARLNKRMTLADFDRAARLLAGAGIGLRAFVLVGAPFVPPGEDGVWVRRSLEHAVSAGAGVVSLIPVRGGNGELERLEETGEFRPPLLAELEGVFAHLLARQAGLPGQSVVLADLWDAERLAACPACRDWRIARLARMNLSGELEPPVECEDCGGVPA